VEYRGLVWTGMDIEAFRSWVCGRQRTFLSTAWRSTDQEVGCSSRPGRAAYGLVARDFKCPVLVEGFEQGDLWEPFARSNLVTVDERTPGGEIGRRLKWGAPATTPPLIRAYPHRT
jgi:hypothetical protein